MCIWNRSKATTRRECLFVRVVVTRVELYLQEQAVTVKVHTSSHSNVCSESKREEPSCHGYSCSRAVPCFCPESVTSAGSGENLKLHVVLAVCHGNTRRVLHLTLVVHWLVNSLCGVCFFCRYHRRKPTYENTLHCEPEQQSTCEHSLCLYKLCTCFWQ